MIMERKRLDDLDEALRQADEQIKLFRETTKRTTVDLLNQHRCVFSAAPVSNRSPPSCRRHVVRFPPPKSGKNPERQKKNCETIS